MILRAATVDDLRALEPLAREFHAASSSLTEFNIDVFEAGWRNLLGNGYGAIFILEDGARIAGAIGGVAFPDICHGNLVAQEFFFFVAKDARGVGTRLYREFENWAKSKGCLQMRMILLVDSMPEKLDAIYRRWGYRRIEVAYSKELQEAA